MRPQHTPDQHTTDQGYQTLEEQGAQGQNTEEMSLGRKVCWTISSLVAIGGGSTPFLVCNYSRRG